MNSFIENVNYLASLDNKYGDRCEFIKTNLSLRNVQNDITLRASFFVYETMSIESVEYSMNGAIYSDLNAMLSEFKSIVDDTGYFTSDFAISDNNNGFLVHSISFNINSINSKVKISDIELIVNQTVGGLQIYHLHGDVINSLKILPTLALFDKSILAGTIAVGEYFNEIKTVSDNIENVNIVSEDIENVNTVGNNILPIGLVGENILNVNAVSENINNVNIVGNNIDDVAIVSTNIEIIESVSENINNINEVDLNISSIVFVANNLDKIIIDADNIGNIVIVGNDLSLAGYSNLIDAGSITDDVVSDPTGISIIETVATNIANVNLTGSNISDVNIVADSIGNIVTVGDNISNVNLVGESIANVNIIVPVIDNIDIVADNILTVNSVANNIVDIQNAEENAQIAIDKAGEALDSEIMAEKWARNPEDVPVVGTFGIDDKYSAYHWAQKAEAAAGGSITLESIYDVDASGILNGGIIRYDDATNTWKDYDFAHNDKIGFDLSAGTVVNEGELAWNADEGTLDLGLPSGSTLQIGQENIRTIRNGTASTISNGTLCMFDGTIGNSGRIKVKPFTSGFNEAMYLYGVATQNINSGSDGIITIEGKVRNIDTTGALVGEVWTDGDILYANPNGNGMMTNIVPADNELKLVVATVIKANTSGTLEIRFTQLNENMYYTKVQNDILLSGKVPLSGDFILDLGGL